MHALNGKKILEMNPGERVAYSWDENTCFTDHVDVNVCAVWRFNQLVFRKKLTVFYSTNKNESHGMNKKVSIATLSAFLVATSPAMAVNEANTLYVNLELSLNRTTVGMIIQSISEQTGYEFSYDESILSKEISGKRH